MAIRDRGKKKWQFAFGMPELIKAQRYLWTDQKRIIKSIIDEYEKRMKHSFFCFVSLGDMTCKFI